MPKGGQTNVRLDFKLERPWVVFRACISRGAKGAMAPPLFEVLLVKTCSNYHSKIRT